MGKEFGHRKGAFTGAIGDREGLLDGCGPCHTVFLDEIGEVEPSVQVKLLRALQSRVFQRVGDSTPQRFEGKFVAATNRNLIKEELRRLVLFAAHRILGADQVGDVADEAMVWIERHLTLSYPWPGNMRELEQRVRSIVLRGEYWPIAAVQEHAPSTLTPPPQGSEALARTLEACRFRARVDAVEYMVLGAEEKSLVTWRLRGDFNSDERRRG